MTTKYPTLAKPPIKEAILQLLVLPSDTYEQDLLKIFVEKESDKYPNNAPQKETLIQFISGEEGQHAGVTNKGVNGYKITSEDGQNIAQVFKDRLAVSRLDSYTTWDDLLAETQRLWGVYIKNFRPQKVATLSVRYINQFMLPPEMKSFEDYLDSTPNIPDVLPQGLATFYVNYKLPDPDMGAVASVQLLFEGVKFDEESKEPRLPIVLDIDIFMRLEVASDAAEIWDGFSKLRDFKNEIFFETLKEKTLEMFR